MIFRRHLIRQLSKLARGGQHMRKLSTSSIVRTSAQTPKFITLPPKLRQVLSHKLTSGVEGVCFNQLGVVLEEGTKKDAKLVKLALPEKTNQSQSSYTQVWQKSLPDTIERYSDMFMLSDGHIVMRHFQDSPTYIMDQQFNPIKSYPGDFGHLCGTLGNDKLAYVRDDGKMSFYNLKDHAHITDLCQNFASPDISICQHPGSGWLAIADGQGHTLDVFDSRFQHQFRHELEFVPRGIHAAAAVGDVVVVAESLFDQVFVYNWGGELLEQLHLGNRKWEILGVGPADGTALQLYRRDDADYMESNYYLHVYQLE